MGKVTFSNKNRQFFQTLKASVDAYFQENSIKKTGNWRLYTKTLVLIPVALGIYCSLLIFKLPLYVSLPLCSILGVLIACIGFNVMHDACHGSYSERKWVNNLLGLSLNAMGGTAFFWKQKHNILHHTYTNIEGADDDISQTSLLRQCPSQKWMPIHRYQHIYMTFVYSLILFSWVSLGDFKKYFTKRINKTILQEMDAKEHITFWVSKILYLLVYIAIPIYFVGPLAWLIGYATMGVCAGVVLAYVFQLAHTVEGPEFDAVGMDDKLIETEWAIHQIRTTANFAPGNNVLSWFVGGLNYQVEHHLFPRISHVHYPALSKIVKETCEKYQLPYHCFPTLGMAVASHVRTMKVLGQKTTNLRTFSES